MAERIPERITGGCACGRVRYAITGELGFSFHCQCRKCQRITGTGHSSAFLVEAGAITVTGDLSYFEQPSDSGYATRAGFCARCGSPVMSRADRFPENRNIHAASLDDPGLFRPERVIFRDSAQPWDHVDPTLE